MNSFLICVRDDGVAEIYQNGLKAGTVSNGTFEIFHNKNAIVDSYPITLNEELIKEVSAAIKAIEKTIIVAENYQIT